MADPAIIRNRAQITAALTNARDPRRRGFRFMGSTIFYTHMQATVLFNDHSVDCFRRREIIAAG